MPHTKQIKIVFFSILVFYLASFVFYERWETNIIGGGDSWGYNAYLPALFIHHDLDNLETTYNTRLGYHAGFEGGAKNPLGTDVAIQTEDGKQVIKYTVGVAILQAPFFLLGHLTAAIFNYPTDGYSIPYIIFDHLSAIFYVFLGLWFLIIVWRKLFSEGTTTLLLVSIMLATNLYYFTAYNGVMAHAYLFGLYSLLIYSTDRFYTRPNWKMALLIGISAGMITLIRPVEIFCLAIPVFYGIKSIKNRFAFILDHKGLFVIAAAAYALMGFFQMIYWKGITGKWIYYSYGDEGFNFKDPQILSGLTSFHNGWLIYTPIMVFALIGILFLIKKRDWLWSILLFLPIHIYITYSWWCWYYINGFGSRPMVETYALLSIPLGYTILYSRRFNWSRYLLGVIVILLAILNIFQTHQLSKGVMWSETASKAYYMSTFGKTTLNKRDLIHYESNETQPDTSKYKKVKELYFNNFEDSLDLNYQKAIVHDGQFTYRLTKEQTYAPGLSGTLSELGASPGQYMRISAWCYKEIKEPSWWSMSIMVGYFERNQEVTKFTHTWIGNKLQNRYMSLWDGQAGVWDEIVFFVKVPKKAEGTDNFKAFIQNGSGQPVYIDNFKVELWERD
jgi:hypothetical protein